MLRLIIFLPLLLASACTSPQSSRPNKTSEPLMITWKQMRDHNVVKQQYDYSCGAAALATLMRYYFQDEVDERTILEDVMDHMDERLVETCKCEGLSMLTLKQAAQRRGYQAVGVKMDIHALARLRGPVLVYLDTIDGRHFSVLKGVAGGLAHLADPARGNVRLPVADFIQEWPGFVLVLGRQQFGLPNHYALSINRNEDASDLYLPARRAIGL